MKDFYESEKLLNEIVDNLINLSDKHFVIVTYTNFSNWIKGTTFSKFKNVLEIDKINEIIKVKKQYKDTDLQMKIDSIPDNPIDGISINE